MAGERSAAQKAASIRNLNKARRVRLLKLTSARGGGAPLRARRARQATPKFAKTLTKVPAKHWLKGLSYRHARKTASAVYSRTGGNLAADRMWRGRLVPMAMWRKGQNPRRYDLGMMRKGRMRRIFD